MSRPDLEQTEMLQSILESRIAEIFTAMPGNVKVYNPATRRAVVQPGIRRRMLDEAENDTFETLPPIPEVPVAFLAGGSFEVHFDLSPGDSVLLIWSQWDSNLWRTSGAISDPQNAEQHGIGSPIAIPWKRQSVGLPGNYIACDTLSIGSPLLAKFVAIAELVDANFTSVLSWLAAHTHPVAGAVAGPSAQPPPTIVPTPSSKLKAEP